MAKIVFNKGIRTNDDPANLRAGELVSSSGAMMKAGDANRLWNQKDRTEFDDITAETSILGVALAKFDTGGSDLILAYSGTTLYSATPGLTGTLASLITGLDSSATKMSIAHQYDRWYFANGYDRNYVIKPDGTTRRHGMLEPSGSDFTVTLADGTGGTVSRPGAEANSGFGNPSRARDADLATFSNSTLTAAGSDTCTWTTFGAQPGAAQYLVVRWRLVGFWPVGTQPDLPGADTGIGVGGGIDSGYNVTVKIEYSVDVGSIFSTLWEETRTSFTPQLLESVVPISVDADQVQVRITHTYNSGTTQSTLLVADIRVVDTSSTTPFTPNTGFYYGWTEYDANEGIESSIGPVVFATSGSAINQATVPIPSAAENTNTTDFRLYRTADGGTSPSGLGVLATVPVSQAGGNFLDTFSQWGQNDAPFPLFPMVTVESESGTQRYARDTAPQSMSMLTVFKARMLGLSRLNRQALYGAITGRPDSWPDINLIDSFPFEEHDVLVSMAPLDDVVILGAEELMIVLTDFPETISGVFNASRATPLKGAPGCVGQYAMATYSVEGEQRAAWISPFGIHVSNGTGHDKITDAMDWDADVATTNSANFVLTWDISRKCLIFNDGTNEWLLYMDAEHQTNGKPLILGPTPRPTSDFTSGLVSGKYRIYSAHPSDGKVYLEENGLGMAATVVTARHSSDDELVNVSKARLRHGDWGGRSASVQWTSFRDTPNETLTRPYPETVALNGNRKTDFYVGMSGEGHQVQITLPAGTQGYISEISFDPEDMGDAGRES